MKPHRFLFPSLCLTAVMTLAPAMSMADQWNGNGHHGLQPPAARQAGHAPAYRWDGNHYRVARQPTVIHTLPPAHSTVVVRNQTYIVNNGRFYQPHAQGWITVAAPLGWISATLPLGAVTLHIGGLPYFFADGVYYRHQDSGYEVVAAPQPAVADSAGAQVVTRISLLNVRSGPGLNFPVMETVGGNTALDVYGSAPGWYYVRLQDNSYGWVMSRYTSGADAAG